MLAPSDMKTWFASVPGYNFSFYIHCLNKNIYDVEQLQFAAGDLIFLTSKPLIVPCDRKS